MLPVEVFDFIVGRLEGGPRLVNDPEDPGGLTRWGISAAAYPAEDIVGMTRDRAMVLYDRDYWQAVQGDQLPRQVAVMVFDCAVNQGARTAVKCLQAAVQVTADGVIGAKTIAAARARDARMTVEEIADLRIDRYWSTKGFDRFGRGWIKRLNRVLGWCSRWPA